MAVSQFTIYRSTDSSAPTLSGTAGDLVNLLDKCLVAGYGSKSAAGWTKPYTGTNKAAFKQGSGSAGFYLRVQDDAPGAGGAKEARITGYETMSDVDTGTGPFPTAAQGVGSVAMVVARKSAAADATTRSWIVAADAKTAYVFISTGDTAGTYFGFMFGDIYSYLSNDSYRCLIIGRAAENSTTGAATSEGMRHIGGIVTAANGHFMPRSYTGIGTSITASRSAQNLFTTTTDLGAPGLLYPNPTDNTIYISPMTVVENSGLFRGKLRGLWAWGHVVTGVSDGDTFDGSGDLAGRSFLLLKTAAGAAAIIETSNTVETN